MKRTFFYIIAAMLLIVVTIGCKKDKDVTHVTLDKKEITINVGESAILEATVHPGDATNKAVSWKSSDEAVAKVVNGTISAQQGGRATITVTTEDGGYTATCVVTVIHIENVTGVTLDKTHILLPINGTATLTAAIVPNNATNKTVSWASSNSDVATVTDGLVYAKAVGTATITVTTEDGNYTATCAVTVDSEKGIEIAGIKWATRNVGAPGTFAATPEDAGMFYQWSRNVGWSATDPLTNSDGGTTWDGTYPDGNSWEKANDPCPSGWRLPKNIELHHLATTASQWTTLNDVDGRRFGSLDNSIFLPAAGYRGYLTGGLVLDNDYYLGAYWSTELVGSASPTRARFLGFTSTRVNLISGEHRMSGLNIRCVAE